MVKLPTDPQPELFESLAELAWNLSALAEVHQVTCIGIANSGVLLAEAMYKSALDLGKLANWMIIDPHTAVSTIGHQVAVGIPIMIDNAVTTGDTVGLVKSIVNQRGYYPKTVVRIFDREDVGEDGLSTVERVKVRHDLNLISIIRLRDIILHLPDVERQTILLYQSRYGTPEFRQWIGGQDVL